jgi:hypothetical protein
VPIVRIAYLVVVRISNAQISPTYLLHLIIDISCVADDIEQNPLHS